MPPRPKVYSSSEANDLSWIQGKTVLVTGGTDGLGLAGIKALCRSPSKPARIILLARNPAKAKHVEGAVTSKGVAFNLIVADCGRPKDVFAACREVEKVTDALHCIWNNAGLWNMTRSGVETQEDGLEMHFAVNYLAMAILVTELRELLARSAPARVVVTGSFTSMEFKRGVVDFDNLQCENGRHTLGMPQGYTYSHSKLMQHVWCKHYAKLLPRGVTINVGCPGQVATNICIIGCIKMFTCYFFYMFLPCFWMSRQPFEGCKPLLHAIGSQAMDGVTGQYVDWGKGRFLFMRRYRPAPLEFYPSQGFSGMPTAPTTSDEAKCKQLYDATEAIIAPLRQKYNNPV
eukprot:CAMPEP_0173441830 /NCGR_PEP_ID=MMETSP1357-20121228/24158_1 /TAXON_ID=77926 /ORGANISM="Hemiselmis rufescens, Strain PCC563" /LENGTH=344 /DNA_ID=CAMNT_0014407437 /DNA_START=63 /DNA_END=1097 /DNA_ORIENTATION=-